MPVWLPRRREGKRGSLRPRQIDRASAKRVRCQVGAAHQLRVRSQGSLLVASRQWAAAPQALVARPFVPLVAYVPYLSRAFNLQRLTAGAKRAELGTGQAISPF